MKFILSDPERDKKFILKIGMPIILIASFITITNEIAWFFGLDESYYGEETYSHQEIYGDGVCNVARIDLKGFIDIDWYEDGDVGSSDIMKEIKNADNSENIKAIILDIDSSGGVAVAGEEISDAFSRAKKPTVAVIRTTGTSAAYWSAIGTDKIFASENSDIGSIGVTSSYLDNVKKNQIEGFNYNQISSGKFKDVMNPDKALTYEEKQYLMRDVNIIADNFIKAVAEKRNLSIDKVKSLADGSSMLGQMALENGLIDEIGGMYEVEQYIKTLIDGDVVICQ